MPFFVFLIKNLSLADSKFITFPAHVLDQNGQMQFATAGNFEAVCIFRFLDAKTDICIQFAEETVS